ncbi:MAG: T9SS type A sorting domain-containing protein, partial [candidate division Zixibacteria bacterium]|nr:T9SS type A sorting domain-containing protein [candidate division Zixibacteria bacterium]MBD3233531.1 T9SS type A sorting domain-containing protein [candidate division Zixibacteria bacterium]
ETLVDGQQEAGYHSVTWDASNYSSGVYFYKLTAGDKQFVKKMMLVK